MREFSTTFPEYAALASSGFPIAHTNAMEAVLESLEAVEGDLSGDQEEFQAGLARTELDARTATSFWTPTAMPLRPTTSGA